MRKRSHRGTSGDGDGDGERFGTVAGRLERRRDTERVGEGEA